LFTLFYGFCVLVVHQFVGWRATALYACSLPVASLIGLYYVRGLRRFAVSFRAALVLLRAPVAAEKLLRWRAALIQLIETEREEFLAAQETRTQKGA
jgi:hypothetical protein